MALCEALDIVELLSPVDGGPGDIDTEMDTTPEMVLSFVSTSTSSSMAQVKHSAMSSLDHIIRVLMLRQRIDTTQRGVRRAEPVLRPTAPAIMDRARPKGHSISVRWPW